MKRYLWVTLTLLLMLGGPLMMAQSTSACVLNQANRTVTICTPQSRTSAFPVESPVRVVAYCTDSTRISIMQVYINGQKITQVTTNHIDLAIPMANGNNTIAVLCQDTTGAYFSTYVNTAVSGGCTLSDPGSLVSCEPVFNTTAASPIHFVARDIDPDNVIHGMRVLNSGTQAVLYQVCGRLLDAWIRLAPGTYNLTVESLYSCTEAAPGAAEAGQLGPITVF